MFSVRSSEIQGVSQYVALHRESLSRRDEYWRIQGDAVPWRTPYTTVFTEDMEKGRYNWFDGGTLNPLESMLGTEPSRTALILHHGGDPLEEVSFGGLLERAAAHRAHYRSHGVVAGDRVLLYLPNSLDLVAGQLALAAMGATAVPLFYRYPGSFIARAAADCGAKLLILDDTLADAEYRQRCDVVEQLVEEGITNVGAITATPGETIDAASLEPFESSAPLFLYYHSTGAEKPKGYVFTAGGFTVHTRTSYRFLINDETHRPGTLVFKGELASVPGMAYGLWGALAAGDTLALNRHESAMTVALIDQLAGRPGPSWFMVTPGGFATMKASFEQSEAAMDSRFDKVLLFGDVVSPRLARFLGEHVAVSGEKVFTLYMQRQTGVAIIHTLGVEELSRPGSMGVPGLGIRPGVFSDFGAPCAINQSGQLAFAGTWPGMATTIYHQHDRFVQLHFSRIKNHYASGDGVRLDEHGCFWFMKRLDDVFKLDGFSISTTELETLLAGHSSVREAAVIGLEGTEQDNRVALFVTPEDARLIAPGNDQGELFREELRTYLKERIGEFALPYKIVLMTELPRTRTGKVVRRILHRLALDDLADLGDLSHVANPESVLQLSSSKEDDND